MELTRRKGRVSTWARTRAVAGGRGLTEPAVQRRREEDRSALHQGPESVC